MQIKNIFFDALFFAYVFCIVGCNTSEPSLTVLPITTQSVFTVVPTQSEIDVSSPTLTPTSTNEPTFTATYTSSPTETLIPTQTLTFTPTPLPIGIVSVGNVNLRVGPGNIYPVKFSVILGTKLIILGQSQNGLWFFVRLETGEEAWILVELVKYDFSFANLAVLESPPTPVFPTHTPAPLPMITVQAMPKNYRPDGITIFLDNFPPGDSCLVQVFNNEGEFLEKHILDPNEEGHAGWNAFYVLKGEKGGIFLITVLCESGISLQTTYYEQK